MAGKQHSCSLGRLWKFPSLRADTAEPRVWASHQGRTDAQDRSPVALVSLLPAGCRTSRGGWQWRKGLPQLPPLYFLV